MKKIAILMMCISLLGSSYVFGQKKFQTLVEEDNVSVSYYWKSLKPLKKDSPSKLVIKIDNDNEYPVEISFEVEYFWDMLKEASTGELSYCLKANRAISGDLKKPGFDNADFTNEQISSQNFLLELNNLKIVKIEKSK